jgi:ribosomal protein S18 acetylase RimI-like enzyme
MKRVLKENLAFKNINPYELIIDINDYNEQQFPLTHEFLTKRGKSYFDSDRKWLKIEKQKEWIGNICLHVNHYIDEVEEDHIHVSVLEIGTSFQGKGLGTEVMNKLFNKYKDEFHWITLQAYNGKVKRWYKELGFNEQYIFDEDGSEHIFLIKKLP